MRCKVVGSLRHIRLAASLSCHPNLLLKTNRILVSEGLLRAVSLNALDVSFARPSIGRHSPLSTASGYDEDSVERAAQRLSEEPETTFFRRTERERPPPKRNQPEHRFSVQVTREIIKLDENEDVGKVLSTQTLTTKKLQELLRNLRHQEFHERCSSVLDWSFETAPGLILRGHVHEVLAACDATGDWKTALRLFRRMQEVEIAPSAYTTNLVVEICLRAKQLKQAVRRKGVPLSDSVSFTGSEAQGPQATRV
ncbi:hypothetical protein CYMTET_30640 [Cymbomonas tetramitiformis]|uniref:Pentatricopeptide repeat-containing protein n=1 Tax=Cymbomonas tetramitiformis TaxID=36881 RepID=A0AAE0FJ22_9CHLO|nr:hypothetical protein CYMTET_30640 [Cymbomonas tetramitiformis]